MIYLPLAGVAERLVCYTETRIFARPRVDLSSIADFHCQPLKLITEVDGITDEFSE